MSRRALPPLSRDIVFIVLGAGWGSWTIYQAGPWPLMLISAATMLGPGFLRLWLSGPGTRGNLVLPPPEPPELSASSSPGQSTPDPGAEAA